MSKAKSKYSPEVRERAVRMVLDNTGQHKSRWAAIVSVSEQVGCVAKTLNEWVKKAEVERDTLDGFTTVISERLKALEGEICALRQLRADLSLQKQQHDKQVAEKPHEKAEAIEKLVFSSFSTVVEFLYAEMGWMELDAELGALKREVRTRILRSVPAGEPDAYRAFQKANDALFHLKRGDKGYREAAERHWLAVTTCLRRASVEFGVAQADQNRAAFCVLVPDAVLEQAMEALEGTLTRNPPPSLKIITKGKLGRSGNNSLAKKAQRFAVAYLNASEKGLTGDNDPIVTICGAYDISEDTLLKDWVMKFRNDTFSFPETLQFIADREKAAEQLTTAHPHLRPKPGERFNVFALHLKNYARQYQQNRRPPPKKKVKKAGSGT